MKSPTRCCGERLSTNMFYCSIFAAANNWMLVICSKSHWNTVATMLSTTAYILAFKRTARVAVFFWERSHHSFGWRTSIHLCLRQILLRANVGRLNVISFLKNYPPTFYLLIYLISKQIPHRRAHHLNATLYI